MTIGRKEGTSKLFEKVFTFLKLNFSLSTSILKQLPLVAQKQLEKSKATAKQAPMPTNSKSIHSPTNSPRTSSSLGRYHPQQQAHHDMSPSNSNTSNGSSHSTDQIKRSMSPRLPQTHHQQHQAPQHYPIPSSSTSPTPPSNLRKTRVPTLNRKKSAIGLISKRKPHFMTLLHSDDSMMRGEGLVQLSKKLAAFPYPVVSLQSIHMDVPNAPPVDGDQLKSIVLNQWEENYAVLSTWDSVTGIMLKLFTFEEYLPKLILEAQMDESARRSEADIAKYALANLALTRAKLFLQCENPDLIDILFTSLVQYGGFVSSGKTSINTNKKDITRLPANRRKLTKQFLEWMDELVTPLIGLNEDIDFTHKAYEGVPNDYTYNYTEKSMNSTCWFESDDNVRQCLAILLPLITTSTPGTMWHAPLITFMKHLRLLNQRLFENVTATYDDYAINKICRVLGIHIRVEPPISLPIPAEEDEDEDDIAVVEEGVEDIVHMDLPVICDDMEESDENIEPTMDYTPSPPPPVEEYITPPSLSPLPPAVQYTPSPLVEEYTTPPLPPVVEHTTPPPPVVEHTPPPPPPVVEHTSQPPPPVVEQTPQPPPPVVEHTPQPLPPVVEHTSPPPVVKYASSPHMVEHVVPLEQYTPPPPPVVEYIPPVREYTPPNVEYISSPPPPPVEEYVAPKPRSLPSAALDHTPTVEYTTPSPPLALDNSEPVVENRESAGLVTAELQPIEPQPTMIRPEGMVMIAEQAPVYTVKRRSVVNKEEKNYFEQEKQEITPPLEPEKPADYFSTVPSMETKPTHPTDAYDYHTERVDNNHLDGSDTILVI